MDALAEELHDLALKENEKRKILKSEIEEKMNQHENNMASIRRRIEDGELIEKYSKELVEARDEHIKWEKDRERL